MFDRLRNRLHDARALGVLMTAAEEAARAMGDGPPGAEHFLLAATAHPDGAARRVLERLGIEPSVLRSAVEAQYDAALASLGLALPESGEIAARAAPTPVPPLYDAQESGRTLLRHVADSQGRAPFSSARVLGAIAGFEQGVAARTLLAMGIEREALRTAVDAELADNVVSNLQTTEQTCVPNRTISSRRFNQDPSGAKRAARAGPVLITHRGEASHVLLTIEDYRRLTDGAKSVVELIGMKEEDEHIEFDPPKLRLETRPADLS